MGERVLKFIAENGAKPLTSEVEFQQSGTKTLPWKTVTACDRETTYVAIFAYTKYQSSQVKPLNGWIKHFFKDMDGRKGEVLGYTATFANIYEGNAKPGCCKRAKIWGEHHAILAVFKDLESMRVFYHSPIHQEATKYNGGEISKSDIAVARVMYVKGSDLPPSSMPGAWSGAQTFIQRALNQEFPRYEEAYITQSDALEITGFEIYKGDNYEEGFWEKKKD